MMKRRRVYVVALALGVVWCISGGHAASPSNLCSRRGFVSTLPVAGVASGMPALAFERPGIMANPGGVFTDDQAAHLTDGGERLSGCLLNQNCVATSSVGNPTKFGPPWEFETSVDVDTAWTLLQRAVAAEATLVQVSSAEGAKRRYLRAEAPSRVPPGSRDVLEFLLDPKERKVLYRSATRDTVFVYPLQTPVSDGGANRQRLERIRVALGWQELSRDPDPDELRQLEGRAAGAGATIGRIGAFSLWDPKAGAERAF